MWTVPSWNQSISPDPSLDCNLMMDDGWRPIGFGPPIRFLKEALRLDRIQIMKLREYCFAGES